MPTQTEKPIIFNSEMVRAILAGKKTMTRRVIKPQWPAHAQPKEHSQAPGYWIAYTDDDKLMNGFQGTRKDDCGIYCPFGAVGDRLWVRESAYIAGPKFGDDRDANMKDNEGRPRTVGWAASMDGFSVDTAKAFGVKNTPSIHMPRWASRLTLEVTGVRVERLQDITPRDVESEGIVIPEQGSQKDYIVAHIGTFMQLWDSINGKRASWESNPWVWVVSFKRVNA